MEIRDDFTKGWKRFIPVIFGVLFLANILAWIAVYGLSKSELLEVTFFDVGQGDAIFIETPQGHQILIDGGPSSVILEKLGAEMPFWDRSIDLIVLTHPEQDHMAGLIEVLKRYKVDYILWTGIVRNTNEYNKWCDLIKKEEAKIIIAQRGQQINLSNLKLNILYPFESLEGQQFKNANNTSIVSSLIFNEISFLFTGDIYKSVERKLIKAGTDLNSDILKVAHHGSKTSSSEEFIEQVFPEIAVISAAQDNRYGHPHQETLSSFEKFDINILRTDEQGDIQIISDGNYYKIISGRAI